MSAPLGAAASLLVGWGVYRAVESPIRASDLRTHRRFGLLLAVCCLLPVLAAIVLDVSARATRPLLRSGEFALPADVRRGCAEREDEVGDFDTCRWAASKPPTAGSVYLVGDSNASQLSDGLLKAIGQLNLDATVLTRSACPFAAIKVRHGRLSEEDCLGFLSGVQARIRAQAPDVVVVATAADVFINDIRSYRWRSRTGASIDAPEDRAAAWAPAMISLLKPIAESGSKVVIVLPPPKFSEWLGDELPLAVHWLGRGWMDPGPFSKADALARRQRAETALRKVAASLEVTVIDPFDEVCPTDPCNVLENGRWVYRDPLHISVSTSERLAPLLRKTLTTLLANT